MACPDYEALVDYAAGDGDAPEVASHVASGCPDCRAALDAIAALRRLSSAARVSPKGTRWTSPVTS